MRTTAARLARQSLIEVERKFVCNHDLKEKFRNNQGFPAFQSINHLGHSAFEDVYFDHKTSLIARGIWLRKRNGHWQAKIRTDAEGREMDFTNTRFEELSEPTEILRVIRKYNDGVRFLPGQGGESSGGGNGLEPIARYTTYRDTWKVNGKFEVVFDRTDFGHWVGEVELQEVIELGDGDGDGDGDAQARKQARAAKLDAEIEGFIKTHAWAFSAEKPVGKLSAYFARHTQ